MKQQLLVCALAMLLFSSIIQDRGPAAAEKSAPPENPESEVALLNLTRLFREHKRFIVLSAALKDEVEIVEEQLKARKNGLELLQNKLQGLTAGSDAHTQLTADIARETAVIKANVDRDKKQFLRQESKIYLDVLDEVRGELKRYAQEHGIRLVLRFNDDPFDHNDPQEVLKELNKSILFFDGPDITDPILDILNDAKKKD